MICFVLVVPAIGVCQIIPDKWLSVGNVSSLCVFTIGLSMAQPVRLFSKVLAWIELRDANNAKQVSSKKIRVLTFVRSDAVGTTPTPHI